METLAADSADSADLLRSGAQKLTGHKRRLFVAEVTLKLCGGNARLAESQFGWGRQTIRKGLQELDEGIRLPDNFQARGSKRLEDKVSGLEKAIRELAEPQTQTDPELKSSRRYLNLSAREVLEGLRAQEWAEDDLPGERSMRRILNRLGYRLKRIQKGRPSKKTADTDTVFANVKAVKATYRGDPTVLEISADTKAKVAIGDYFPEGGGTRTDAAGKVAHGLDHDPPSKEKWTPFGFLVLTTGMLLLVFGLKETSDRWGDALQAWWQAGRDRFTQDYPAGYLPG